jgi:hypothetical protein
VSEYAAAQMDHGDHRQSALVHQLRTESIDVLDGLLRPDEAIALIDFPTGGNVGDQAIWLGTTAYLHGLVRSPAGPASMDARYRAHVVASRTMTHLPFLPTRAAPNEGSPRCILRGVTWQRGSHFNC